MQCAFYNADTNSSKWLKMSLMRSAEKRLNVNAQQIVRIDLLVSETHVKDN